MFPRAASHPAARESNSATAWALRLSVAFAFAITGAEKFPPGTYWPDLFARIGLGQWFRYFTGAVELGGGLLFLWPAATTVGAALLAATMLGAMTVWIFVFRQPVNALYPGLYLLGVAFAYWRLRDGS